MNDEEEKSTIETDVVHDSGANDKVLNNSVLSRVIQRFPVEVNCEEYLGKEGTERNAK